MDNKINLIVCNAMISSILNINDVIKITHKRGLKENHNYGYLVSISLLLNKSDFEMNGIFNEKAECILIQDEFSTKHFNPLKNLDEVHAHIEKYIDNIAKSIYNELSLETINIDTIKNIIINKIITFQDINYQLYILKSKKEQIYNTIEKLANLFNYFSNKDKSIIQGLQQMIDERISQLEIIIRKNY